MNGLTVGYLAERNARIQPDGEAVVPEGEAALTESDIVGHVEANLAGFKKPREIEFRDELPRNPTGKVLKNELT